MCTNGFLILLNHRKDNLDQEPCIQFSSFNTKNSKFYQTNDNKTNIIRNLKMSLNGLTLSGFVKIL